MPKYAVTIRGDGYLIEHTERSMLVFERKVWRKGSFTATRYVETDTPARAADLVMEMIKYEIIRGFRETEDATLSLHEIKEDPEGFHKRSPGDGFEISQ